MGVKLLKIRVERFEAGKPLSKPVYLNMPCNQKMVCLASKGDFLRPNLLERLSSPGGVTELYANAPDAEDRNPDTYPIYLEDWVREKTAKQEVIEMDLQEDECVHTIRMDDQSDAGKVRILGNEPEESFAHVIAAAENTLEDAGYKVDGSPEATDTTELKFTGDSERLDEGLVLVKGAQIDVDDFSRMVSGTTEVLENDMVILKADADPVSNGVMPLKQLEPKAEPVQAVPLGSVLVGVVRQFAKTGERNQSTELKFMAGAMGETARVFFNSSAQPSSANVSRALADMEAVWNELSALAVGEHKESLDALTKALADAISVFRRECKAEESETAAA